MSKKNIFIPKGSKLEENNNKYLAKIAKSGKRKCPGHWISKRARIKNISCYDDDGRCGICGGFSSPPILSPSESLSYSISVSLSSCPLDDDD